MWRIFHKQWADHHVNNILMVNIFKSKQMESIVIPILSHIKSYVLSKCSIWLIKKCKIMIMIIIIIITTRPFSWNFNFHRNLSDSEIKDLEGLMRSLDCLHITFGSRYKILVFISFRTFHSQVFLSCIISIFWFASSFPY